MGDKTQLVALTQATCYRTATVLWALFWATLFVHLLSAAIGWFLGDRLPGEWIGFMAGVAFVIFGVWTLHGETLDGQETETICRKTARPFWIVFSTFFIAELGDKTMLSTTALATNHDFFPVWIGSTLGMVLSDALAVFIGKLLGRQLPEKTVRIGCAVVFFLFGFSGMYQNGAAFPLSVWGWAALVIALATWFFFPGHKQRKKS